VAQHETCKCCLDGDTSYTLSLLHGSRFFLVLSALLVWIHRPPLRKGKATRHIREELLPADYKLEFLLLGADIWPLTDSYAINNVTGHG